MPDQTSMIWNAPARKSRRGRGKLGSELGSPPVLYPHGKIVNNMSGAGSEAFAYLLVELGLVMVFVLFMTTRRNQGGRKKRRTA